MPFDITTFTECNMIYKAELLPVDRITQMYTLIIVNDWSHIHTNTEL